MSGWDLCGNRSVHVSSSGRKGMAAIAFSKGPRTPIVCSNCTKDYRMVALVWKPSLVQSWCGHDPLVGLCSQCRLEIYWVRRGNTATARHDTQGLSRVVCEIGSGFKVYGALPTGVKPTMHETSTSLNSVFLQWSFAKRFIRPGMKPPL